MAGDLLRSVFLTISTFFGFCVGKCAGSRAVYKKKRRQKRKNKHFFDAVVGEFFREEVECDLDCNGMPGGGSVREAYKELNFTEGLIAAILKECLTALAFLHAKCLMHLDVKGPNLLLGLDGTMKLADFGTCYPVDRKIGSFIGTYCWLAPEVVTRKQYSAKADILSVGITAIEMLEKNPPYVTEGPDKILSLIQTNGKPPIKDSSSISADLKDFMNKCLEVDVTRRATATELLMHPFIGKAWAPSLVQQAVFVAKQARDARV